MILQFVELLLIFVDLVGTFNFQFFCQISISIAQSPGHVTNNNQNKARNVKEPLASNEIQKLKINECHSVEIEEFLCHSDFA